LTHPPDEGSQEMTRLVPIQVPVKLGTGSGSVGRIDLSPHPDATIANAQTMMPMVYFIVGNSI
jgi:hypothetical protein